MDKFDGSEAATLEELHNAIPQKVMLSPNESSEGRTNLNILRDFFVNVDGSLYIHNHLCWTLHRDINRFLGKLPLWQKVCLDKLIWRVITLFYDEEGWTFNEGVRNR